MSKNCCRSAPNVTSPATAQMYDGTLQITHPDRVVDEEGFRKMSGIDPVYPLTEGLALGSFAARDGAGRCKSSRIAGMDQSGQ